MRPDFRVWLSHDHIVLLTKGHRFYLSINTLGVRLRLHSVYPYCTVGRT